MNKFKLSQDGIESIKRANLEWLKVKSNQFPYVFHRLNERTCLELWAHCSSSSMDGCKSVKEFECKATAKVLELLESLVKQHCNDIDPEELIFPLNRIQFNSKS